ncbi:MAG: LETM1 domain-containing protein [Deltaproteobacteria bacterium]|nr:LETM1 domain-containing protein [Deltaproteobacteria bacterium]
MNLTRKGWFAKYVGIRSQIPFPRRLATTGMKVVEQTGVHNEIDEAIYYFLAPTGLMHGFPVTPPFPQEAYREYWPKGDYSRIHLIFLESLFACMVADRHYLLKGLSDETDRFSPTAEIMQEYFLKGPTFEGGRRWKYFFTLLPWTKKDEFHSIERIIGQRVGQTSDFFKLPGYYYNSFLLLDLYHCILWQRRLLMDPAGRMEQLHELGDEQTRQRELLLKLLILAAESDGLMGPREKKVVKWFFRSSGLPGSRKKAIWNLIGKGVTLDDIEFTDMPWLIRRFFLDAVLMMLIVERGIIKKEFEFAEELVRKLNLWEGELAQSKAGIELFFFNHQDKLRVISKRSLIGNISESLKEGATIAVRDNLNSIVKEIQETRELYNLLIKSTHEDLTVEEREKVKAQLMDIVKSIPALAIFALPGGGLIMPVILKLLPYKILPTAFRE